MSLAENDQLDNHRITVLLVDDQAIIGQAVSAMFENENEIDFHYCQDSSKAVALANKIKPTVILQDLVMPGIDGLQLVKLFRKNDATRHIPLIVLSGKEKAIIKAKAFELGANDYMVKFPDAVEVLARVRHHSQGYINLLQRNQATLKLARANKFIRKTFGQYMSESVVETILASPEGLQLGGEKRNVTILLTDLRGFTSIGERLPAEDVVKILNIYLQAMTEVINKFGGTIDAFIGDAILAMFGAPVLGEEDAQRAVACAIEMQLAMQEVNRKNLNAGLPEVAMGVGLNTGESIVGNIGSNERLKYGVIGRNVNLASRIESYTIGGQILASQSTVDACGDILRIDDEMEIIPKGVKEPLRILEIGGISGKYNLYLPEKKEPELQRLSNSLTVRYLILAGKYINANSFEGRVTHLSKQYAEMESVTEMGKNTNIRLVIFDKRNNRMIDELYAKVTKIIDEIALPNNRGFLRRFRVSFTSVPQNAEDYLKHILSQNQNT